MEKLTVNKADAVKYYKAASSDTQEVLRELFGAETFKLDYTSITTYADACHVLGLPEHIMASDSRGIMELQAMASACYKLMVICKAMNSDTGKYYDNDGYGYFPVFTLYTQEELDDMGENERKRKNIQLLAAAGAGDSELAGVRCAITYNRGANTNAYFGFPLCLNSEEKAEYVGKVFFDLCCACYGLILKK